ncbi:hypothetical protein V502_07620 [Pseudogymnoascus sp. VKM F-4520 (FW-2644)]|nr:hypothetical protein V502_07620 [Pseudogymnoascus sp. VKM F-4520 (FW-2644)]
MTHTDTLLPMNRLYSFLSLFTDAVNTRDPAAISFSDETEEIALGGSFLTALMAQSDPSPRILQHWEDLRQRRVRSRPSHTEEESSEVQEEESSEGQELLSQSSES